MFPHGIEFHLEWPGVLETLARATLILAAAWAAHLTLGQSNPRWRVTLWRGALTALVVLPLAAAIVPSYPLLLPENAGAAAGYLFELAGGGPAGNAGWNPWLWLGALWSAGAALSFWRLFAARRSLTVLVREAARADEDSRSLLLEVARGVGYFGPLPDLRISPRVEVPFACGVFGPTVVVPMRMRAPDSRGELAAVLAHEVTHLRSADLDWNLLAQALRALLWFHPLVRPLPAAHRAACEDVCNVTAAGYVGDVQTYSKTLARVALATVNPPLMEGGIPMASRSTVLRRLDFLKKGIGAAPLPKAALGAFVIVALAALFCVSALSVATGRGLPGLLAATAEDYLKVAEVMPKPKSMPKRPEMPEEIARQKVNAITKIEFFVDDKGAVDKYLTNVVESSGFAVLDSISLTWADGIEFYPALNNGAPVKVRMAIPITWKSK